MKPRPGLLSFAAVLGATSALILPGIAKADGDHVLRWNSSSVYIRRSPDAYATPIRITPADFPPHPEILEFVNGFYRIHDPALSTDVYVLRRDVVTESGMVENAKGAVSEKCVQRGTMGMQSCD